jgi:hypothetical protein
MEISIPQVFWFYKIYSSIEETNNLLLKQTIKKNKGLYNIKL